MCEWLDSQNKAIRIILFLPWWGWIFSFLYRVIKYADKKATNPATLVIGILCVVVSPVGFVVSLIDLITTCSEDKLTFCVD